MVQLPAAIKREIAQLLAALGPLMADWVRRVAGIGRFFAIA